MSQFINTTVQLLYAFTFMFICATIVYGIKKRTYETKMQLIGYSVTGVNFLIKLYHPKFEMGYLLIASVWIYVIFMVIHLQKKQF